MQQLSYIFFGWAGDPSWDLPLVSKGWWAAPLPSLGCEVWSLIMPFSHFPVVHHFNADKFSKKPPAVLRLWKQLRLQVRAWRTCSLLFSAVWLWMTAMQIICMHYCSFFMGVFTSVDELWTNNFKLVTLINGFFSFFSCKNSFFNVISNSTLVKFCWFPRKDLLLLKSERQRQIKCNEILSGKHVGCVGWMTRSQALNAT